MIRKASSNSAAATISFEAKLWLAVPPPDIARRFNELTAPLMIMIKTNSTVSRALATLRDTLLPKLLSEEVSVSTKTP